MSRLISRAGLAVVAAALLLGACGGSDDGAASDDSSASTTLAPEDVTTSDAAVAKGLADIKTMVDEAVELTSSDKDAAVKETEEIHEIWEEIEGTIKANDQDTYIAFEDAFAKLEKAAENGDATKAKEAAESVKTTADAYLAAHPG